MKKKEYISPAISVIEVAPATMIATSNMQWTQNGNQKDGLEIIEEDEKHPYDDDSF